MVDCRYVLTSAITQGPVWRRGPQAWGLAYCCNYISYLHSSEFCKWSPVRLRSMCWGLGPQFICGPTCHCLLVFLGWVLSPSQTYTHWTLPASKSQWGPEWGCQGVYVPQAAIAGGFCGGSLPSKYPHAWGCVTLNSKLKTWYDRWERPWKKRESFLPATALWTGGPACLCHTNRLQSWPWLIPQSLQEKCFQYVFLVEANMKAC